jgi:hypothetical protein
MITLTREEAEKMLHYMDDGGTYTDDYGKLIETLRARLSEPEPEPVAWGIANTRPTEKQSLMMVMLDEPEPSHMVVPLYTAPPQREWQGLTDEEIKDILDCGSSNLVNIKKAEQKLKEKNT